MPELTVRLLRVNLSDQTTSIEDVSADVVRTWVGGTVPVRVSGCNALIRALATVETLNRATHAQGQSSLSRDAFTNSPRQKLREIAQNIVLPKWKERCGNECAQTWSETVGRSIGLAIK